MATLRHMDFEVSQWGEFDAEPRVWTPRIFSDDFNWGPNGTPLETSPNWIKLNTFKARLYQSRANQDSPLATGCYRWAAACGADQFVEWDSFVSSAGGALRIPQSGYGGYTFYMHVSKVIHVKCINADGSSTFTGNWTVPYVGGRLRVEAVGNQFTMYQDGSPVGSFTDATWPDGYVGLGAGYAPYQYLYADNWRGGEL
ncbi:MAG: hypothetical protein ACYC26_04585 [Phycisphaerales bacterium]